MKLRDFLALSLIKGIGPTRLKLLEEHVDSLKQIHGLSLLEQKQLGLPNDIHHQLNELSWHTVDTIMKWSEQPHHHLLTWHDPLYPHLLLEIYDPPPLLYVKGDPTLLRKPSIAMVGSRHATASGAQHARQFAHALASQGLNIVSGLAEGIDSYAHQGALAAKGHTIAVMGTGIDRIYPHRNKALAEQISQTGALITEFSLGASPHRKHFPRRNRIISGLSQGVLVVEASLKSGSLITARCALEQGREIYAIPSSINNPTAKGCHYLIKEGAKLVETIEDILGELVPFNHVLSSPTSQNNSIRLESHLQNLVKCVGYEATSLEQLLIATQLSPQTLNCQLSELELRGLIKAVPGGYMRL